jgi:hypothetical protein
VLQVVPQALGPPGRPGLRERPDQVPGGGRLGRARAGHDEVERFGAEPGFGAAVRYELVNLADRRGVGLPRLSPVVPQQRNRTVPARRAAHRPAGGPLTAHPHRHPGPLHGRRQEYHVVDDHVLAPERHRLA